MKKQKKEKNKSQVKSGETNWFTNPQSMLQKPSPVESYIAKILKELDVEFFTEVSFQGLVFESIICFPRFDFFIPDLGLIIEYDSRKFHSKPQQIARDHIKTNFCIQHGISIIRLKTKDYKQLPEKITEIIRVGSLSAKKFRQITHEYAVQQNKNAIYNQRERTRYVPPVKPIVKPNECNKKKLGFMYPQGMTKEQYEAKKAQIRSF